MDNIAPCRIALLLVLCLPGVNPAAAQDVTADPDRVRLEVGDRRRLAKVLQSGGGANDSERAALIERDYLTHASPGLRAYAARHGVTPATIAAALAKQPKYAGSASTAGRSGARSGSTQPRRAATDISRSFE